VEISAWEGHCKKEWLNQARDSNLWPPTGHYSHCSKSNRIRLYWASLILVLRGRLHLRFKCAVWMGSKLSAAMTCVFGVQHNMQPITLDAAHLLFWVCSLDAHWNRTLKRKLKTYASLHAARHATTMSHRADRTRIWSPKTHVIAADHLLHIQTAHPKRKCNRPFTRVTPHFFSFLRSLCHHRCQSFKRQPFSTFSPLLPPFFPPNYPWWQSEYKWTPRYHFHSFSNKISL
jgi:hypothetical protein